MFPSSESIFPACAFHCSSGSMNSNCKKSYLDSRHFLNTLQVSPICGFIYSFLPTQNPTHFLPYRKPIHYTKQITAQRSPLQETFPPTRAGSSHFFIPTAIALYLFFQSLLIIFLLCNDTHRYKIYIYVYINQISGLKNYFNINTTLPHTHPNLNCSNPKLILL